MATATRSSADARFHEMWGFVLLAGATFLLLSLATFHPTDLPFFSSSPSARVQNVCGVAGAYLAAGVRTLLGLAGYLIPFVAFLWASACFLGRPAPARRAPRLVGFLGFCVASATVLSIIWIQDPVARVHRGGLIGLGAGDWLVRYCGVLGGVIVALTLAALSFLLATEMLLLPILTVAWHSAWRAARTGASAVAARIQRARAPATVSVRPLRRPSVKPPTSDQRDGARTVPPPEIVVAGPAPQPMGVKASRPAMAPRPAPTAATAAPVGAYRLPSLDLLDMPPPAAARLGKDDLQDSAKVLQDTLLDFGIEVHVAQVEQGPVITRYELEPAPGVKVTKITGLSDDIALAMKAPAVRIIAPIPGKSRIGVEVPNTHTSLVALRHLLESPVFHAESARSKLTLALGQDTAGHPLTADLGAMPHLLIAGTTGSGKTVCMNSLIMSLLVGSTPEEIRFLMVDPKMVELAIFNGLPHLLAPVQTDPKKVSRALHWVVMEMENRYKLFAKLGLRNIEAYHAKWKAKELPEAEIPPTLPYLIVIIDELADLMMVARTEVETAIGRLAQLSRAVGIHMVLATQRPSVDVLTGVIKANFPARISFQVASKVDARTVLDQVGAEKLLGKGDLLFMKPGAAKLIRAQGCLVTDPEIERVVSFIKTQRPAEYNEGVFEESGPGGPGGQPAEKDPMHDEAVQVVLNAGQASVSLLQRRLRLGYGRAARILDVMEQEGIVGPIRGAKPREVLVKSYQGAVPPVEATAEVQDADHR
ncbi:MAG: DNA translocase FtsK [Candidatus Omnitrophica bacterium]|nr:DNA translocase FtsK [Candidatus Omnitrophota bacterium]